MKLKIFDYLWHIPHQSDMLYALKEDCEFYFCLNIKTQWDFTKRYAPPNIKMVTHYERGVYDVAILHVDQQVVSPKDRKRIIYEDFNNNICDIPKIVINHGSPVLPEWFKLNSFDYNEEQVLDICRNEVKALIGDNLMVVNSHAAASDREWGFGLPIVHGMNYLDWDISVKEPRVFTAVSPGGFDAYYNRDCLKEVSDILSLSYGYKLNHARVNIDFGTSPQAYKNYLASSLLYFDPSYRTPMNRARTEALLSGCCVIQVEGAHDLERWAIPGENIVIVPNDPTVIASTIVDFIENRYQEAVAIGLRGREMARIFFNTERYRADWLNAFELVLNDKKINSL